MVIKINYTSSDVYVSTSVSPVYVVVNYSGTGGGGGAVWGGITGTLSDQTDLQTALDGKFDDPTGTTAQYLRGDGSLATFPNLDEYVPYIGASTNVDLGEYDLTVNEMTVGKGNSGLSENTAIGKRTLFNVTFGNYNTALGHEAGYNITNGEYNTAIGQSSLLNATIANQNTAIGSSSLLLTTTGGLNTAVGYNALRNNTTGVSNTAIGYNAGSNITGGITANSTSSTGVYIGRDTKAKVNGGTNEIVIGFNAVGNGSNTATIGNSSITANYFTGSINGGSFVKSGGTSSQFLKADGSVDSSSYVPYTGATTNVNLGEFGISGGYFQADLTPTLASGVGRMIWNDTDGTMNLGLKGGSVNLHIGQNQYARAVNGTGVTLTRATYRAVKVTGAQGQRLQVNLAKADNDENSTDTLGLIAEDIGSNQEGFICTSGVISGLNTTGSLQGETWNDGDIIYLSPYDFGFLTNIKPNAPEHSVIMGFVVYAHANNGKIFIKVSNGYKTDDLHDVHTPIKNNNDGMFWVADNDRYESKSVAQALGYTPISGSGATGQVAYWNGTNSQTGSNNLFWDNTNGRLGIGTNAPSSALNIVQARATISFRDTTVANSSTVFFGAYDDYLQISSNRNPSTGVYSNTSKASSQISLEGGASSGIISFFNTSINNTLPTEKLRLFGTGNLVLQNGGTFTDGGQRLQVYGDTLLRGSGATSATTALTVQNSAGNDLFKVQNNGEVKISSISASIFPIAVNIFPNVGGTNLAFYSQTGTQVATNGRFVFTGGALSQATGQAYNINSSSSIAPTSGTATFAEILLSTFVNQTGGANGITRGLYVNPTLTAAADWRSIEWSNNSGWGLYGAGTANNYLGGSLGIGTTSPTDILDIRKNQVTTSVATTTSVLLSNTNASGIAAYVFTSDGTTRQGGIQYNNTTGQRNLFSCTYTDIPYYFGTNNLIRLTVTGNTGNILINTTTDAGFKLDVNGTARVSGVLTFANASTGGTDSLFIGVGNVSPFGGLRNVQIGNFGGVIFTGSRNVAIGSSTISVGNSNSITIGNANTNNGGFAIGYVCTSSNNGIAIGVTATSNFVGSCVIGTQYGASSTTSDQFVVESSNWYLGNVLISNATTNAVSINGQSGNGTNINANTFTINGGRGTGSGTSGDVIISTATTTTSGTTLQSLSERLRIKGTQGSVRFIPIATPSSAEAGDVYYDSSTNKLRCYNGSTWNDLF